MLAPPWVGRCHHNVSFVTALGQWTFYQAYISLVYVVFFEFVDQMLACCLVALLEAVTGHEAHEAHEALPLCFHFYE